MTAEDTSRDSARGGARQDLKAQGGRLIVHSWLDYFDPPPQINFQQSECLQALIDARIESDAATIAEREAEIEKEWLPIETAPKDGTWVLIFDGRYGLKVIELARWIGAPHSHWGNGNNYWTPSHWRPLPAPPASRHSDGERR